MNKNSQIRRFFLFLLLLLSISISAEERVHRAALVIKVNGLPLNIFQVLRGNEKLNVLPSMSLQDGDWICVREPKNKILKNKENYVILSFGAGHADKKITYENSPYLVKQQGSGFSLSGNLWDSSMVWFKTFYEHYLEEVTTGVRSKSDFSMPLLSKSTAQLVAGNRTLHLAWQGGTAPYDIQVFQVGDNEFLLEKSMLKSRRVAFEAWQGNIGNYRVVVQDSTGNFIEGKFSVVPDSLPVTQEIGDSGLSEQAQLVFFAAWLMNQENGAWRFEAYQQIAELAKTYQPALLIMNELENDEN